MNLLFEIEQAASVATEMSVDFSKLAGKDCGVLLLFVVG
jgi:hypothetical protein